MAARGEISNSIQTNGELELLRDVARLCRERGVVPVFLDIGAHVGEWTMLGIEAGATVHAFEPVPSTFAQLEANIGGKAVANRIALSCQSGEVDFHIVGDGAGTNSLLPSMLGTETTLLRAPTIAADQYAEQAGLETIHLMKIDTEGHDLFVLQGAKELLRSGRLWVAQFEYNYRWLQTGKSIWAVFQLAEEWGLAVARVTPHGLEVIEAWNAELDRFFEANFALVQPAILPGLKHIRGAFDRHNAFVRLA